MYLLMYDGPEAKYTNKILPHLHVPISIPIIIYAFQSIVDNNDCFKCLFSDPKINI